MARIPSAWRETRNASSVSLGGLLEFVPNLITFSTLLSFPNLHRLERTYWLERTHRTGVPSAAVALKWLGVRTAGILAGRLFATTSRFVITHHEIP